MALKKRKAEVDHGSRKRQATETSTTRRVTRGMTTDAARRAVFGTAELLENIIMQLPPRKIFVIQRVCKQFRDIVATSVKLQQRLFLRSDGCEAQEWRTVVKRNEGGSDNRWPITGRHVKSAYIAGSDEIVVAAFKPVRLGHSLEHDDLDREGTISLAYASSEQMVFFRLKRSFLAEPHSSLAKTYLTDPPMQQVTLYLTFWHMSDWQVLHYGNVEVSNPEGLKVADILQAIRSSKFSYVSRHSTATHEAKHFRNVSLPDVTGDENFFEKRKST
ncbi:hypothetical protein BTJ68_14019 [Hortaea werneckii EXF-2000]|uniref:F-box domain-containing protein n=2 Tax=Hortaea werneckii TaxID=91943 RepID=A0A3M7I5D4_HORWE|nr:hypothetical protein BTJ68_14019 [Hortaea werneckii EXF-2000]RMZ04687.1 hypothetical protein D0860_06267 [Hortaea werneckii]RMZ20734.1 hypothetical protein D0859_15256 [Hortaea werneckii]